MVNGKQVGVKYYHSKNGFYTFELSLHFQNKYQMAPYIPGSGSISDSLEGLDNRLHSYIAQVEPDARAVTNKEF
jgi:hypothetical protein